MKKAGQTTKGRGVSLPYEISDAVDQRIESLGPWVRGFSDYVQGLIRKDLEDGILAPPSTPKGPDGKWCAVEGLNLRQPPCQGDGLQSASVKKGVVSVDFSRNATMPEVLDLPVFSLPHLLLPLAA